MAGLLDFLSPQGSGTIGGGMLDYLAQPLYRAPRDKGPEDISALLQSPYEGALPQLQSGTPQLSSSIWDQPGIKYAQPPAPTVWDNPSSVPSSWLPPPQAAPTPPPLPAPAVVQPAPQPPAQAAPQQEANPQQQLPPNAQPTQGQLPPQVANAGAPEAAPNFGLGNNLMAGLQNFANSRGILPALGGLVQGLSTGARTDPLGMQQQSIQATFTALKDAGVPANQALAAAMNPKVLEQIAPQYFSKNELVDGGTDPFTGQKIFYWKNGANETLIPANPSGNGNAGQVRPSLESFQTAVRNGVSGEALYNYLPKEMSETVRAMIEGRRPAPTGMGMRNPAVMAAIEAAHTIDPTFDETSWASRNQGRLDWTKGTSSNTARSANQSAMHAGELVDKMMDLPGHQIPTVNAIQNAFNTEIRGKGAQGNFLVNAHALADELSTLWKQHNISDTEIRAWESRLTPNMSEEQQQGMMRTLAGLYRDSIKSLEQKRLQAVGPVLAGQMGPILGPDAEAAMQKVERFGRGRSAPAANGGLPSGWSVKVY